jgi:hypothetical protein
MNEIDKKLLDKIINMHTMDDMLELLKYGNSEREYIKGITIIANNKMDKGIYRYTLEKDMGDISNKDFKPHFSPKEMLDLGIFEGRYLNDCILEFPVEWFLDALENGKLSPEKVNIECNYFKIKSRMSLGEWKKRGWIPQIENDPDNRGWFQWYCRYWLGRRIEHVDNIQIKRWRAFNRHFGQVKKNCNGDLNCRPKQRQALLQWCYNAFI